MGGSPRTRLVLAVLAVGLLAVTAGCLGLFGNDISDEQLDEEATYDWDTERDVTINVTGGSFTAVYALNDTDEIAVFRRGISSDEPLDVSAVRYRYPNGTILTGSQLEVYRDGGRTHIRAPTDEGRIAFTGPAEGKEFRLRDDVEGTYEVILPPNHRVGNFLFGDVRPRGHRTEIDDRNRVHVIWDEPIDQPVTVRYYLGRDLGIFVGLVVVLGLIAIGGVLYYIRQIRTLEEQRREYGLDVDYDDEFDDEPPPGMG